MNQCLKIEPGRHRHDEENVPAQKGKMFCAGVCFFNFLEKIFRKRLTIRGIAGIITPVVRHGTNIWGISSAGRALAWHARGHRFDPGILHQKSTVLRRKYGAFLFAEAGFWGCIASPALFSKRNVCRPFFQQAAASSPSIDAAKGGGLPQ